LKHDERTPYTTELEQVLNAKPLSLRQMKWISALYGALVVGLLMSLMMPAGVIVIASALGILVW